MMILFPIVTNKLSRLSCNQQKTYIDFKEVFCINTNKKDHNLSQHQTIYGNFFLTIIDDCLTIIDSNKNITRLSPSKLPCQDLPGGGIIATAENIFVVLADGNIMQFNWNLTLIKNYKYKHNIISKVSLINNKLYFVDYNNSLISIHTESFAEEICTTQFICNNCVLPLPAPIAINKYIVFLSSYGQVIFVDYKKMDAICMIVDYKHSSPHEFPIMTYNNGIIVFSDHETLFIEFDSNNKPVIKWSLPYKSHSNPVKNKDTLVVSDRSTLFVIDLAKNKVKSQISLIENILHTIILENIIVIFTANGEIICIDQSSMEYTKSKNGTFKDYERFNVLESEGKTFIYLFKNPNSISVYFVDIFFK